MALSRPPLARTERTARGTGFVRRASILAGLACAALWLVSCSDDLGTGAVALQSLQAPLSVRVAPEQCQRSAADAGGMVVHRWHDGACERTFVGMRQAAVPAGAQGAGPDDAPEVRRRILSTGIARISVDELFNWAQAQYPQYFPSARPTLKLGPYQYRYYPETQNHVAVADGVIYIQGPISGGDIARVGTVIEFECLVQPNLCGAAGGGSCVLPTSWTVGTATCNPGTGGGTEIQAGDGATLVDSSGRTIGSAQYTCQDGGQLTPTRAPICVTIPDLPCDTGAVTWNQGANVCNARGTDPKTLDSGQQFTFTDLTGTTGNATFRCTDGALTPVGTPTCQAPPGPVCNIPTREWKVGNFICDADVFQSQLPSGSSVTFNDALSQPTGSITYVCDNGTLLISGTPTCFTPLPLIQDSFGGPGGAADGSANGDGTAADGAPIVGGTVTVVDRNGKTVSGLAPTDAQGYFRVKLDGMVPPLVVKVRRPDGVVRHSLSTQSIKVNGYIFMAVTGLTDWIAADVAARSIGVRSAAALTGSMIASNPSAVGEAVQAMVGNQFVAEQLTALGIAAETFDPLTQPFRPNSTGYDAVLDNLVITTNASGEPVIGPTYCNTPSSWTVGNFTCLTDADMPKTIPNQTTLIVRDSVGSPRGTVGFSCIRGVVQAPVLPTCQP